MQLKNLSDEELVISAKKVVQTERKILHWVLAHLQEIEARKIFAKRGYDGMYTYMTRELGYSGAAATLRLKALRLMNSNPAIANKVQNGSVCLSQLAQVQNSIAQAKACGKNITADAATKALEHVVGKSTFETKSILAKEFDLPALQPEFVNPQKDDSVRLEITLTAEQFKELEQAKNLLSHVCHGGSWSEVIAVLAEKNNQRLLKGRTQKKPLKVSPDDKAPHISKTSPGAGLGLTQTTTEAVANVSRQGARRYISLNIKRRLQQRSGGCCEYQDPQSKRQCGSKYQLQIDHIKPWSQGGSDEFHNLRILCRTHNNLAAEEKGIFLKKVFAKSKSAWPMT
jgi:hypothetical protein